MPAGIDGGRPVGVSGGLKFSKGAIGESESNFWVPPADGELLTDNVDDIGLSRSSRRSAAVSGLPTPVGRDDDGVTMALGVTIFNRFLSSVEDEDMSYRSTAAEPKAEISARYWC